MRLNEAVKIYEKESDTVENGLAAVLEAAGVELAPEPDPAGQRTAGGGLMSAPLPGNAPTGWNTAVDADYDGSSRADIVMLDGLHQQLCVVADLLRILIEEQRDRGAKESDS